MTKPRIGITRKSGTLSQVQETSHERYRARVEEAGGLPVDLTPRTNALSDIIEEEGIQGLIVPGGGDLNPLLYGEQNRASHNIDDERDRFEIELMRLALDFGLPVLAICRGFQILNVACGGMLLQDIGTPPYQQHVAKGGVSAEHSIDLIDGSRLRSLLAKSPIAVNSRHHQAVTRQNAWMPTRRNSLFIRRGHCRRDRKTAKSVGCGCAVASRTN